MFHGAFIFGQQHMLGSSDQRFQMKHKHEGSPRLSRDRTSTISQSRLWHLMFYLSWRSFVSWSFLSLSPLRLFFPCDFHTNYKRQSQVKNRKGYRKTTKRKISDFPKEYVRKISDQPLTLGLSRPAHRKYNQQSPLHRLFHIF